MGGRKKKTATTTTNQHHQQPQPANLKAQQSDVPNANAAAVSSRIVNETNQQLKSEQIRKSEANQITNEMKELLKDVVDLKITNDSVPKASSSSPQQTVAKVNINSEQSNAGDAKAKKDVDVEGIEPPAKSKEEVIAERKAKAAEAKAKKAAAAAAKKAAAKHGAGAPLQPETNDKNHGKKSQSSKTEGNKHSQLENKEMNWDSRSAQNEAMNHRSGGANIAVKSAISNGAPSLRPSQPFKHVHFDMTPADEAGASGQRQRHPSFTDVSPANVHRAFLNFAARCEAKEVIGIDAICVAFIAAFKEFLSEYKMSENRKMSHDLDQAIRPHFSYLTQNGSQPFPLALGNLIRQLKKEINQLPDTITESDGKNEIAEWLDDFCSQNFDLALRAISSFCLSKMQSTNCVLTYTWCPIVERVLLDAYEQNMDLHVCILDSPVQPRGRRLAQALSSRNIECTYGMLNAIGYVMKQCRMVLLGCSAILSNGYIVADRGASQVALVAAAANVPVLVVAQTLKFVDRVQTFDRNVRQISALVGERQETIPSDLITAIVTELRIVPPSSAPAVLKAKQLAVGS